MEDVWEVRDCKNCQLRLGCPHSKYAGEYVIEPTDFMKPVILSQWCDMNKIG